MNTLPNIQKRNYTTLERDMAEAMREMQLRRKNTPSQKQRDYR